MGCWVVAAGAEACTYCAKWERAGALYCVLACCGRLCMLLGVVCGAERSTSERGEQSAHTAPRAPWQQRRDELHGRQILADFGRLCMRMRAAHLWSRTDDSEGGPARAAAGDKQGTTRVRVCLSLSLSPQRSALSHITPLIIYQTHQRKTHNGNATRKRRTRHTRGTRAHAHTRSRGRYRCRGTGAGRDTRERCKKAERLSRQGRTTAPDAAPSRSPHSQ